MAPLFLDANIFLYAMGIEHPEKAPCRKVLDMVAQGRIEAVTSSEVMQEVLYVRLRRGTRSEALSAVRNLQEMVDAILPVTGENVLDACELLSRYPSLDARDAVHAAVAKGHGISSIVTVDRDFESIKGLRRLSPTQATS
ncbi:MAG TPA: type II toxin-antitoxin system VapC family toxin [Fibrobacteria bacterium]|nr:type II toxin-antitoxin system VapC family toxin [Fibrobacteria bacterium]